MAIPLSYNVRNLRLRKSLTIMTALGIALTVATAVFIMALLAGLGRAFATTGDPLNVLMLRKGSDSELAAGGVSRDAFQVLKELPGIAKNAKGEPLASGEDILVVVLPRKGGTGETNVTIQLRDSAKADVTQEGGLLKISVSAAGPRPRVPLRPHQSPLRTRTRLKVPPIKGPRSRQPPGHLAHPAHPATISPRATRRLSRTSRSWIKSSSPGKPGTLSASRLRCKWTPISETFSSSSARRADSTWF